MELVYFVDVLDQLFPPNIGKLDFLANTAKVRVLSIRECHLHDIADFGDADCASPEQKLTAVGRSVPAFLVLPVTKKGQRIRHK